MTSINVEFLRPRCPELAGLGGFAETYAHSDAAGATAKLRMYCEQVVGWIHHDQRLPKRYQAGLNDLLANQPFREIVPEVVLADLLQNPVPMAKARSSGVADTTISDVELEALVNDFLPADQRQPSIAVGAASTAAVPAPTEADLYAEAQRLLDNLSAPQRAAFGTASKLTASESLGIVIADFVTPGDLLKTPSLETAGRIVPSQMG